MITFNARDLNVADFRRFLTFEGFGRLDYNQPYDFEKENVGQGFAIVGTVPDREVFSAFPKGFLKSIYSVVKVKEAGSDEYNIPDHMKAAEQTARLIAAFEHAHNPDAAKYECVLQLRQIRNFWPAPNSLHWHIDFTRQRFGDPDDEYAVERYPKVDHLYLVADRRPTVVMKGNNTEPLYATASHPFNKAALERDAHTLVPYQIVLLNSYSWHRAQKPAWGRERTFLLMTYRQPKGLGVEAGPR
jgi:hypothetical protein